MRLEDYFEFVTAEDIRIKGHRIGIEDVLAYYLEGYTPEEIAANLPSLSLEQIHATITYYLHHRATVDAYLTRVLTQEEQRYHAWAAHPSPLIQRLRALKARQPDQVVAA